MGDAKNVCYVHWRACTPTRICMCARMDTYTDKHFNGIWTFGRISATTTSWTYACLPRRAHAAGTMTTTTIRTTKMNISRTDTLPPLGPHICHTTTKLLNFFRLTYIFLRLPLYSFFLFFLNIFCASFLYNFSFSVYLSFNHICAVGCQRLSATFAAAICCRAPPNYLSHILHTCCFHNPAATAGTVCMSVCLPARASLCVHLSIRTGLRPSSVRQSARFYPHVYMPRCVYGCVCVRLLPAVFHMFSAMRLTLALTLMRRWLSLMFTWRPRTWCASMRCAYLRLPLIRATVHRALLSFGVCLLNSGHFWHPAYVFVDTHTRHTICLRRHVCGCLAIVIFTGSSSTARLRLLCIFHALCAVGCALRWLYVLRRKRHNLITPYFLWIQKTRTHT